MSEPEWSLQDAKNHFSAVGGRRSGQAATGDQRGRRTVVVLSVEEYERLVAAGSEPPMNFVEHLLSIPSGHPRFPMRGCFRGSTWSRGTSIFE